MDVQLYVYDLSQGLARQMSRQFLGVHIDAVYHTSLVFGGVEYFFGQGVHTCYPGSTHHGRPMEIIPLGQTALPMEVIGEYLDSLKQIYTAESYDLFVHNCNNFTNDFAMFLVGSGIPKHIKSLPQTVLNTPFGQMLRPQLDRAMRGMTQAPVPPQSQIPPTAASKRQPLQSVNGNGLLHTLAPPSNSTTQHPSVQAKGVVHNVVSAGKLDRLLKEAESSCAVIFFTSATCPPCKMVYPIYDELAEEFAGKATLIKVDISNAHEIGSKYSIRATPTFITFLKARQQDTWVGTNANQLRGNIRTLVQSAFPPHPHQTFKLPTFHRASTQPTIYTKIPALEKLVAKMGPNGTSPAVQQAVDFISRRDADGAQEAPLPDLPALASFLQQCLTTLSPDLLFTAYDLLRLVLADPRASGYFAEENAPQTIPTLLRHVNSLPNCPYNLRLVALHVACNAFSSPIFAHVCLAEQAHAAALVALVSNSLLGREHPNLRVAAASLALNIATAEQKARVVEGTVVPSADVHGLPENLQVELLASLLEALSVEDNAVAVKSMVLSVARLVYCAQADSEVLDLCRAMDARAAVLRKQHLVGKEDRVLLTEVEKELLGKGLDIHP